MRVICLGYLPMIRSGGTGERGNLNSCHVTFLSATPSYSEGAVKDPGGIVLAVFGRKVYCSLEYFRRRMPVALSLLPCISKKWKIMRRSFHYA